jgi:hypothetical protein
MGDMSQGISGIDPFSPDKTATEVKQTVRQQNVRDQSNQMYLGECISDMMMMWLVNNRQFLFLDSEKHEYILRIIGTDLYEYFKRAGLDEMEVTPEAMGTIAEIIQAQEGNLSDSDVQQLYETAKTPKFPVYENPKEKNPEKIRAYPKMRMNDMNDGAEVSVLPEDLDGSYDYIATTKSMQAGAEDVLIQAQQQAINTLKDPAMLQLLAGQGIKPMIKELLVDSFNNSGLQDAEKYFEKIQQAPVGQGVVELGGGQNGQIGQNQIGIGGGDGLQQPLPQQGVPATPPSPIGQGQPAGMA